MQNNSDGAESIPFLLFGDKRKNNPKMSWLGHSKLALATGTMKETIAVLPAMLGPISCASGLRKAEPLGFTNN